MKPRSLILLCVLALAPQMLVGALIPRRRLYEAAETGDIAQIRVLLDKNPKLINKKVLWIDLLAQPMRRVNGETALHAAVKKGRIAAIEELLKHGANVNAQNNNGDSALHFAVLKHSEATAAQLVTLLLKHKADKNLADENNKKPIDIARKKEFNSVIKLLE